MGLQSVLQKKSLKCSSITVSSVSQSFQLRNPFSISTTPPVPENEVEESGGGVCGAVNGGSVWACVGQCVGQSVVAACGGDIWRCVGQCVMEVGGAVCDGSGWGSACGTFGVSVWWQYVLQCVRQWMVVEGGGQYVVVAASGGSVWGCA